MKRTITILLLLLSAFLVKAQDIHFSQFFQTPLLRNPALAGIFTGDYRISAIFKDQWTSVANAYKTGSLSGEYKWPIGKGSDFLTTGLEILYDKAGSAALNTTELEPALNYHKSLSNDKPLYLSVGFMGGLVQKTIDMSKVTTNNQYNGTAYDPALPNGEPILSPDVHYLDGSLGISLNGAFGADNQNSFFTGFSYQHLNRPKNSFYKNPTIELDPKYVFSAGIKTIINDYTWFTIQADYSKQGPYNETIAGILYSYKLGDDPQNSDYTLSLGGFLRWKDAIIPMLQLDMHSLSVGLSYDANISELKTVSQGAGGFELSISFLGFLDKEDARYRTLCPRF